MADFDIKTVGEQMLKAFEGSLESDGTKLLPGLETIAKLELLNIAKRVAEISEMLIKGEIDKEKAKIMFKMQKEAVQEQLLTVEGISVVLIQNALNAALNAVRDAVNSAIGWTLL